MTTDPWPYPGDGPIARARRVAHAYRARLDDVAPDECRDLDQLMTAWGQTWATPRSTVVELDDWIGPNDAADLAGVRAATLREWRRRGRITGRRDGHTWQYLTRDVLTVAARIRRRRPRRTETPA